jgi:hypothetical protein
MNAAASGGGEDQCGRGDDRGIVAVTPNNWEWASLPRATQGSAMAMPTAIMATASRRTRRMAEAPCRGPEVPFDEV